MAVRTTMSDLIAAVRDLINDPAALTFTDQQVQDKLDRTRDDVRYECMTAAPTLQPGAIFDWVDYYIQPGYWETDYTIQQGQFDYVTPLTEELIVGHFTLPNASGVTYGQIPPVFITGKVYDIYAAAADLLEMWSAKLALNFDFTADGQSFRRSQASQALLTLARQYRNKAKPLAVKARRTDLAQTNKLTHVPLLGNNDVISQ